MSAPSVAVVLAEHVGLMLVEMSRALNQHGIERRYGDGFARVRVEHSTNTSEPFHVFIDEAIQTFHGMGADAGIAMLKANGERQSFYEAIAKQEQSA